MEQSPILVNDPTEGANFTTLKASSFLTTIKRAIILGFLQGEQCSYSMKQLSYLYRF